MKQNMFKNFNQIAAAAIDRSDNETQCDKKTLVAKKSVRNSSNDALHGGRQHKNGKLSIDDESSHPINGSSTNNKSERKRNINMLLDDEDKMIVRGNGNSSSVGGSDCDDDDCDEAKRGVDSKKRMRVDGQDNNKSEMYQVSTYC